MFKLKLHLINQSDIQNKLYPMLQKRINLDRDELAVNVENFLRPYLSLTDGERAALHDFYKTGITDMDILFPQKEIQYRIL